MIKRWPHKYIVGLTGNIATGKSAVLKMAAAHSALTLDADQIVHEILDGDHFVQEAIVSLFGSGIRHTDGRIDRAALAEIVFNDLEALAQLERIVHPAVRRRLYKQIDSSSNQVVFIEAIKLLEGELADVCQEIWVTRCSREVQIERLVNFRAMDRDLAITRVNAQSPQVQKVALADVVIDSGGSMDDTRLLFELAWAGLMRRVHLELEGMTTGEKGLEEGSQTIGGPKPAGEPDPSQNTESQISPTVPLPERDLAFAGIDVRRAQLSDGDRVVQLISKATKGALQMPRSELLLALGERGYLIAQQDEETMAVVGWRAENLVATIDQFFVDPLDVTVTLGGALLNEIVRTANELICEVILAFPRPDDPDEMHALLREWCFEYVDPRSLPHDWQAAVSEVGAKDSLVMAKILRDTRQTNIRYLKRVQAFRPA